MKPEKAKPKKRKTEVVAFRDTQSNVQKMQTKAKTLKKEFPVWIRETLNASI